MRITIIRLLLLMLVSLPLGMVHAQDDTGDGCVIDLEETILALVQAQREADSGNNVNAVATIEQVQADLAALVTACQIEPLLGALEATVQFPATPHPSGIGIDDLQYVDAVSVRDLDEAIDFRSVALAPDGSSLAWINQGTNQICLFPLDTPGEIICDPISETFRGRSPMLHWSPDSRFVAFTADFFVRFLEADIMIYDVEQRQVRNYTDDQIDKWSPGMESDEASGPLWFDAIMIWGPDGYLYFWRDDIADPAHLDSAQTGLYRLKPGDGEPELVRDMTGLFDRFPLYYSQEFSLGGTLSVSPDASQIALIIREQKLESPHNGIWVVSLLNEEEPPQQVATYDSFRVGLPGDESSEHLLMPSGVAWGNGGLYVMSNDYSFYGGIHYGLAHYIDLESGAVIPLTDFRDLTRQEIQTVDETTGYSPQFWMPRMAVLAPDASGLLMLNLEMLRGGLSSLRLVDGQGEQTLLYPIEDFKVLPSLTSGIAQDGTVLMYGYLFIPAD